MFLPIQGWDYTVTSCSSDFIPVFYFIPNYEWISFLSIHGPMNVPIHIKNSGKYDGKYWIRIDKQPETLFHVGFLPSTFKGYPPQMGHVELTIPHYNQTIPPFLQCEINGCC